MGKTEQICPWNRHEMCGEVHTRKGRCPLLHTQWTKLLDLYLERSNILKSPNLMVSGQGNPVKASEPPWLMLEVPNWFDDPDFIRIYALYRYSGVLRMSEEVCKGFRAAWARWYVRFRPLDVIRPRWLRGESRYRRLSVSNG